MDIKEFANECDVVIFGIEECKYCKSAKEFMSTTSDSYVYVDIGSTPDLKNNLKKLNDVTTVPIIYKRYGTEYCFIGGYTELCSVYATELDFYW